MFGRIYPYAGELDEDHECSKLTYIDEDHKQECERALEENKATGTKELNDENTEPKKPCTCTLISLVFRIKTEAFHKVFTDSVIFKMFQSLRFKTLLGLTYVSNYDVLLEFNEEEDCYIHLGVQILTIPEISLKILQDKALRQIFWDKFKQLSSITQDESDECRRQFFWLVSDWKYLIKDKTITYLLETNIIDDFIDHFTDLCMKDAIKERKTHIIFSNEGYFVQSIDYSYFVSKISFTLMKEINYCDIEFNRKIASHFYSKIVSLDDWWEKNHNKQGFIQIPLLRIFSIWLSRFLLTNLAAIQGEADEHLFSHPQKCIKTAVNLLEEVFNMHSTGEIEEMFAIAVKITGRSIGFNDEIKSDKWVNYGLELTAIPKIATDRLSYYFNDPDMILVQCLFMLTDRPELMFKAFMEGYSINGNINSAFTGLVFRPDEYTLEAKDNVHKEISNLKLLLYLLNTLMSDERTILYQWRRIKEFLNYDYTELVDKKIEECFKHVAKYEAIHALVRLSGSNIKNILSKSPKQMADSKEFEEQLNKYAKFTTNREGKKIFSLDPKYVSYFNSYYYKSLNEHAEATKTFEEFYKPSEQKSSKSKSSAHNPLNIKNCSLGFFLGQIRENLAKTDLPTFLINLLKYKKNYDFIDKDVEDYAEQLLKVFLSHVIYLRSEDPDHALVQSMHERIDSEKEFFTSLRDDPSCQDLVELYSKFMGDKGEEANEQQEEAKKNKEEEIKNRKKMLAKRKAQAMMKMSKKRSQMVVKCGLESEASSNADSATLMSEQDTEDVPKCQKCYESLHSSSFNEKPFGFLAAIIKTKLYMNSCEQTYYKQKELDEKLHDAKEHKENIKKLEFDPSSLEQEEFLDKDDAGIVIQTCRHMIHYECLNSYKTQNFESRQRMLLIEDLSINEFSCPLCKHYSNTIIPPVKELERFVQSSMSELDNNKIGSSLVNMLLDLINIIREKSVEESEKKDILLKDLVTQKLSVVEAITKFVTHSIQLTDVRSLSWVLNEKPKIKSIIFVGEVLCAYQRDSMSAEINVPEINLNQIPFLQRNVATIVSQTLLHSFYQKVQQGEHLSFDTVSKLLKIGYAFILLQIAAKLIYEKNGYKIKETITELSMENLEDLIKNMDAKLTISGQPVETSTRFIEGSLSYLRKATAIVYLMSERGQEKYKAIKKLSNTKFSCEPAVELSMLLDILGWNIQNLDNKINFNEIIQQVKDIQSEEEYGLKEFKAFFDDQ